MAHFLSKYHPRRAGLVSNVVETVEYGAASFGFGYVQNRFRNKAHVAGIPLDLGVGVVTKVVGFAMDAFGGHKMGLVAPHVNVIGNAGIGAFFHTLGAGVGLKGAGVSRLLLPPGADAKKAKAAIPGSEILGGISPAPKGDFLSSAELAAMAR